jgi:Mrp family chromosome partitioning ATPase
VTIRGPAIEDLARELLSGGEDTRRIAVMGASPRSGATLTALSLARMMSRQCRVVVADLSFSSPAIALAASEQGAPGLSDLVSGEASFGDIITRDRQSGAHLVGAGRGEVDPMVLQSPRIGMALDALTRVYDHVVMDVGALTGTPNFVFGLGAHAVVVADPALPEPAREMLRAQLMQVGFSGVTILSAPDGDTLGTDPRMAAA